MKQLVVSLFVVSMLAFFSSSVLAEEGHSAKGVINAVKLKDGKLNISHGPISSLGMGAMTMDFKVMDTAMLEDVKKGHEVAFVVEKDVSGRMIITEIEDLGMAKGKMKDMSMKGDQSHNHMH